jgi:hypothetical protein
VTDVNIFPRLQPGEDVKLTLRGLSNLKELGLIVAQDGQFRIAI